MLERGGSVGLVIERIDSLSRAFVGREDELLGRGRRTMDDDTDTKERDRIQP